jgi:hypothetical protein
VTDAFSCETFEERSSGFVLREDRRGVIRHIPRRHDTEAEIMLDLAVRFFHARGAHASMRLFDTCRAAALSAPRGQLCRCLEGESCSFDSLPPLSLSLSWSIRVPVVSGRMRSRHTRGATLDTRVHADPVHAIIDGDEPTSKRRRRRKGEQLSWPCAVTAKCNSRAAERRYGSHSQLNRWINV